ncbi:hypothetical protein [Streptomyces sp. NPDC088246]|uniref:aromatic-ring hydroxylase C-terminal domain-containing protein n=1 Tax=Streptomyces sp. NPDC088246 TaxID=3365842 RepID=UPI0037F2C9CA
MRGVGRVGADAATPASPAPLLHAHWRGDRTTSLLVRPDGCIAWASDHADPAALQAALTR